MTLGFAGLPSEVVPTCFDKWPTRHPTQTILGRSRVGVNNNGVTVTPGANNVRHAPIGCLAASVNEVEYRHTVPRSEVQRFESCAGSESIQCCQVTIDEVADMDVVTDPCAVRRRIVVAENLQWGPSRRAAMRCDMSVEGAKLGSSPISPDGSKTRRTPATTSH